MYHDNEEWYKIWRGIHLSVQNWREEFDEFWAELSKISQIFSLVIKVYNVWAKKSIEEQLMVLKIDAKFEGKLTCAL